MQSTHSPKRFVIVLSLCPMLMMNATYQLKQPSLVLPDNAWVVFGFACFVSFSGQLTKMFFLFPDPHFKGKNHRRRIITYVFRVDRSITLIPSTAVLFLFSCSIHK